MLKATCTFSFDRYVAGETSSLARDLGIAFNNQSISKSDFRNRRLTGEDLQTTLSSVFREGGYNTLNSGPYIKASGKTNLASVTSSSGQIIG